MSRFDGDYDLLDLYTEKEEPIDIVLHQTARTSDEIRYRLVDRHSDKSEFVVISGYVNPKQVEHEIQYHVEKFRQHILRSRDRGASSHSAQATPAKSGTASLGGQS